MSTYWGPCHVSIWVQPVGIQITLGTEHETFLGSPTSSSNVTIWSQTRIVNPAIATIFQNFSLKQQPIVVLLTIVSRLNNPKRCKLDCMGKGLWSIRTSRGYPLEWTARCWRVRTWQRNGESVVVWMSTVWCTIQMQPGWQSKRVMHGSYTITWAHHIRRHVS